MNAALLDQIVEAVLYDGHTPHAHRGSSNKSQRERLTLGSVYPEAYRVAQNGAALGIMQTECVVVPRDQFSTLSVSVRFLQPVACDIRVPDEPRSPGYGKQQRFRIVPELQVGQELFQTSQEAVERRVEWPPLHLVLLEGAWTIPFLFEAARMQEPIYDGGNVVGMLSRRQEELKGTLEIAAQPMASGVFKVRVRVINRTPLSAQQTQDAEAVLLRTFASTHTILSLQEAAFVSLLDPPAEYRQAVQACQNTGTWPVLVGDEQKCQRDTLLSSPVALYDYPKIASESANSDKDLKTERHDHQFRYHLDEEVKPLP